MGWILLIATVATSSGALWAWSYPDSVALVILAVPPALLVFAGWRVWLLSNRPVRWHTVAIPILAVVTVVLMCFQVPVKVRFADSRSDFEAAVREIEAGTPLEKYSGINVGTYEVSGVDRRGANIYFSIVDSGFVDHNYFAYMPEGPTEAAYHLAGLWYVD